MSTITEKPPAISLPKPDAIPVELRERPQWVVWRWVWSHEKRKWDKPPLNPHTGKRASSDDPKTWATLEQAYSFAKAHGCGIGFVFTPSDPFCGIDLDDCRNPETAELSPLARQRVAMLDSYTEVSPSGRGVKVIVRAKLPDGRRRDARQGIELYDSGRYFTITGQHLDGMPTTIEERPSAVEALHEQVFGSRAATQQVPLGEGLGDDDELIRRALAAKSGEAFRRLWHGDISSYPSQSEADLALCSHLAFWTNSDAARIDRLFRRSGLYREKWDGRHGGQTYGEMTIAKALAGFTGGYTARVSGGVNSGNGHRDESIPAAKVSGADDDGQQKDYGHAAVLARLFQGRYRWTVHRGSWVHYDGRVWRPVPEERVAKDAADSLRQHYAAQLALATDKAAVLGLTKKIQETCLYARITGALAFLRGWDGILTMPDEWDRDPWLLNVQNGTLDLRTCTLRPHDPNDLITKLAPVDYDPNAKGLRWEQHISRFQPSPNVRRQIQRDLGRALPGVTLEESLPIWYGTGANGKTTTARVMLKVLGDYADRAAPNLLVQSKYERHPTELADLCGLRLAFSVEVDQGKHLAEALVKELTGGDRKKGRFMRQDFFSFEQTFSIVLIVNHKPIVTGTDEGIWRRIRLIPWEHRIPDHEKRPQEEVVSGLVAEGPAILNWLLDGLRDWQNDHGWCASEVRAASDAYRVEMDVLGDFIRERCTLGPRCTVPKGELYQAYTSWCDDNHERPLSKKEFTGHLQDRGVGETRDKKARYYVGIGLVTDGDTSSISPVKLENSHGYTENLSPSVTSSIGLVTPQVAEGGAVSISPVKTENSDGYTENAPPSATQAPPSSQVGLVTDGDTDEKGTRIWRGLRLLTRSDTFSVFPHENENFQEEPENTSERVRNDDKGVAAEPAADAGGRGALARRVLALAERHAWPCVWPSPGRCIYAEEQSWRRFVETATEEGLQEALAKLEEL